MKSLILIALILLLSQITVQTKFKLHQQTHLRSNYHSGCPTPQYRSQQAQQNLIDQLNNENFSDDRLKVLEEVLPQNPYYLSTTQLLEIIDLFPMTDDKMKVLQICDKFITEMTTNQVVSILKKIPFSDDRLEALQGLANLIIDGNEENKEKIIYEFSFQSDKDKAKQILDDAKIRNCIFGTVTENVATFLIDISGSMNQSFYTKNGGKYTRWNYVKKQLKNTIDQQLEGFQKFNIITISSKPFQWKSDNVDATQENKQEALAWIDGLSANGGTNISDALKLAFQTQDKLEAIYMLTDGAPSGSGYGIYQFDDMKSFIEGELEKRENKVRIYTISFMLGGDESDYKRQNASDFLQMAAEVSEGSYKEIQ